MTMYNYEVKKGENDAPDFYRTELEGGNAIVIYKDDVFPFWNVKYEKGLTPAKLAGQFTSRVLAQRAVDQYLAQKKIEVSTPKE
jgi:hypothetical protein